MQRKPGIRLFPALIAMCLGAFLFRATGLSDTMFAASAAAAATATVPEETDADATHDAPVDASASHSEDTSCSSERDIAAEAGLSKHEIQLLRSLAARRKALDRREEEIDVRDRTAAAAQLRLHSQISELKQLQSDLTATLAEMELKHDARLDGLVKIYESMKTKDAARIFDTLDTDLLVEVGWRMKHASLAAVMAKMDAQRARLLTIMMAERMVPPASMSDLAERSGRSG